MTAAAPKCIAVRDIKTNIEVRRQCGRHLGHRKPVTRATLLRWRQEEEFPKPFKRSGRDELWDARQVREWLQEHRPPE